MKVWQLYCFYGTAGYVKNTTTSWRQHIKSWTTFVWCSVRLYTQTIKQYSDNHSCTRTAAVKAKHHSQINSLVSISLSLFSVVNITFKVLCGQARVIWNGFLKSISNESYFPMVLVALAYSGVLTRVCLLFGHSAQDQEYQTRCNCSPIMWCLKGKCSQNETTVYHFYSKNMFQTCWHAKFVLKSTESSLFHTFANTDNRPIWERLLSIFIQDSQSFKNMNKHFWTWL